MLGSIFHKNWEKADSNETEIVGYWAEDGSQYVITVPPQLRKDIIEMQNWLAEKYQEMEKAKEVVSEIKSFFAS